MSQTSANSEPEADKRNFIEEEDDNLECSYLVSESEFTKHDIKIIAGDKKGACWLVVDKTWIFHKNTSSVDCSETFWECAVRRKFDCQARAGTRELENGDLELVYLYCSDCHQCDQDGIDVIKQEFKNSIKSIMSNDHRRNYSQVKYTKNGISLASTISSFVTAVSRK